MRTEFDGRAFDNWLTREDDPEEAMNEAPYVIQRCHPEDPHLWGVWSTVSKRWITTGFDSWAAAQEWLEEALAEWNEQEVK